MRAGWSDASACDEHGRRSQTDRFGQTPGWRDALETAHTEPAEGCSCAARRETGGQRAAARRAEARGGNAVGDHRRPGRPRAVWRRTGRHVLAYPNPGGDSKPMEGEGARSLATVDERYGPDSGATPRGRGSSQSSRAIGGQRWSNGEGATQRGDASAAAVGGTSSRGVKGVAGSPLTCRTRGHLRVAMSSGRREV